MDENVFPTHVGMDLGDGLDKKAKRSFPHTRGDGPSHCIVPNGSSSFSPHTWGWTPLSNFGIWKDDVFPTHVGMDLKNQ